MWHCIHKWVGDSTLNCDWLRNVKCDKDFSSKHISSCGVLQGLALDPLLYTTPLSTLISSLFLNHHLYADDTQLFFSFHPRNFDSSIAHLQTALQQISSLMSANLLTLNSSILNFSSLVWNSNFLKQITLHSILCVSTIFVVDFVVDYQSTICRLVD